MRRFCFSVGASVQAVLLRSGRRWNATTGDAGQSIDAASASAPLSDSSKVDVLLVMERASEARREIHELWLSTEAVSDPGQRLERVASLIKKYNLDPATPCEEDVSRGLGDAFDRLLLLCVPLNSNSTKGTDDLERLMHLAGRNGRELSVRTIQHLFARTDSFTEALAVFYAMRRCHVAMNMEAYYAMLYSLQRLEEEGWAQRFCEEREEQGRVSEQAMDFVLKGVNNALLPENKPWLGRVMFEDRDTPARRHEVDDYDELSATWIRRYKDGNMVFMMVFRTVRYVIYGVYQRRCVLRANPRAIIDPLRKHYNYVYAGIRMTDFFGHVNNSKYLEMCELARWHHLGYSGVAGEVWKLGGKFVIASVSIEYIREALPFRKYLVTTEMLRFEGTNVLTSISTPRDAKNPERDTLPPAGRILLAHEIWSADKKTIHAAVFVRASIVGDAGSLFAIPLAGKQRNRYVSLDCRKIFSTITGCADVEARVGANMKNYYSRLGLQPSQSNAKGELWMDTSSRLVKEWRSKLRMVKEP